MKNQNYPNNSIIIVKNMLKLHQCQALLRKRLRLLVAWLSPDLHLNLSQPLPDLCLCT